MRICTALLLLAGARLLAQVDVTPSENVAAIVASSPAGTTFRLHTGTYRMVKVEPRANDVFLGVDGTVIFNGSKVLSGFTVDPETGLWVTSIESSDAATGKCEPSRPLCGYPQDVFIDNALLSPVGDVRHVLGRSYYFDHTGLRLFLPADADPNHHVVEMAATRLAFAATAPGVRIKGSAQNPIIVEKYASPAQYGAIGGGPGGTGWIIDGVEVRYNHAAGIKVGEGSQILNCFLHHNGQVGFTLFDPINGSGSHERIVHNEVSFNNTAGYLKGWEAGGGKFWRTNGTLVENNSVHDNNGHGLWFDTCNVGDTIASNSVTGNAGTGLFIEISGMFTVTGNTIANNESGEWSDPWNGQIQIYASPKGTISGNTIVVPHATSANGRNAGLGIVLLGESRRTRDCGAYLTGAVTDVVVSDNTITYNGSGWTGFTANDRNPGTVFTGVHFEGNRYIDLAERGGKCSRALWMLPVNIPGAGPGQPSTFKDWQAAGFDRGGSCTGQ